MAIERLGPYRIERMIGRGGMGVVYAGVHTDTGERVAVKVLSAALAADPRFRDRFALEIETLKTLHHPNIVRLLGYGEDEGHVFYSMELVLGRNLQEELRAGRRFQWREVSRIGVQVCQALKHAHDHGVIHRDLKPANLLYTDDELIKLTDFGIARLFGSSQHTMEGGVLGTADYMSPEQADSRPITARTDLYSLGGVFFALLTGRPPFLGKTVLEVLERLRHEEPPLVRRFAPDVPEEFEQIIGELLRKNPVARVATPQILAKRLKSMDFALSIDTRVSEGREPIASDLDDIDEHVRITNLSFHDDSDAADIAERPTLQVQDEPAARVASGQDSRDPNTRDPSVSSEAVSGQSTPDLGVKRRGASADDDLVGNTVRTGPKNEAHEPEIEPISRPARFTVVDVDDRKVDSGQHEPSSWTTPVAAVALIVVLLGSCWAIWRTLRPDTIDQLYAEILEARDAGPDELRQSAAKIDEFLQRAGDDPRVPEVQLLQTDVDVSRTQRRLELLARRKGGVELLNPAEQAFLVALRTKQSNRSLAQQRFKQLVDVFGQLSDESENVRALVALARHEMSQLGTSTELSTTDNSDELEQRLTRAEKELKNEPENYRRFLQGIIGLYEGQAWAAPIVDQCKSKLPDP